MGKAVAGAVWRRQIFLGSSRCALLSSRAEAAELAAHILAELPGPCAAPRRDAASSGHACCLSYSPFK